MWVLITLNNGAEITLNTTQVSTGFDNTISFFDTWANDEDKNDGYHPELKVHKDEIKSIKMLEYAHDIREELKEYFGEKYKEMKPLSFYVD